MLYVRLKLEKNEAENVVYCFGNSKLQDGMIILYKKTGKIELLKSFSLDSDSSHFHGAKRRLVLLLREGENNFPEDLEFATG